MMSFSIMIFIKLRFDGDMDGRGPLFGIKQS